MLFFHTCFTSLKNNIKYYSYLSSAFVSAASVSLKLVCIFLSSVSHFYITCVSSNNMHYLNNFMFKSESCSVMFISLWPHGLQVHRILQARIMGWVAVPFSRGSSQTQVSFPGDLLNPGIEPRSPSLQADYLPAEPQGSPRILEWVAYPFSSRSSQPRNLTGVSCIAGRFFTSWTTREALF